MASSKLYDRSSQMIPVDQIEPAVITAVREHIEANQIPDFLVAAPTVCATHSTRLYRNGLLSKVSGSGDPDREHSTVALLTGTYLVIAIHGERRGMHVRSTRLDSISFNEHIPADIDSGISVVAHWSGELANQAMASFYLGLGDDDAGRQFKSVLREAIVAAKSG